MIDLVDRGNGQPWPEAIIGKLAAYRQGSLIAAPPFAYHASRTNPIWLASKRVPDGEDEPALIELDPVDGPPFGVITSQDCDIDEEGPQKRKPWVQVAPVYQLTSDDRRLADVQRWRVHYLAPVSALGQEWVADLRIEFPIEKSWLVLQEPRDAFNAPEDFRHFSELCGRYRSRPGLATTVYEYVLRSLQDYMGGLAKAAPGLRDEFLEKVSHVFLDVAGDPLAPTAVQLVLVSEASLTPELLEALNSWWDTRTSLPFAFLQIRYLGMEEVRLAEYLTWYEQDLRRLAAS